MAKPADVLGTDTFLTWRTRFNTLLNFAPEVIEHATLAPINTDDLYAVGTIWIKLDTDDAYVLVHTTEANDAVWNNISGEGDLKADGTVPLTANWDVGAFTITGTQLISDIAIGTAPFVVTSTTVVPNLNVSQLEGNAASAFATAAQGTTADNAIQKDGSVALTANWNMGQTFSSTGIDDNATANRILLTDTEMAVGGTATAFTISGNSGADGTFQISADAPNVGANIILRSGVHFPEPFDIIFRASTVEYLHFHHGTGVWDFGLGILKSTGTSEFQRVDLGNNGFGVNSGLTWGDGDTNLREASDDDLTLQVGGVSSVQWETASSHTIVRNDSHVGITASVTQTQAGAFVLLSSRNEISVCASAGDAVKVPICERGKVCQITNNGANNLQIFPWVNDDLGAGVDLSVTLEPGKSITFEGRDFVNWDTTGTTQLDPAPVLPWSKSITVENPSAAEDITVFFTPVAITITEIRAVLIGSATPTVTWTLMHGTDRSAAGVVIDSNTTTSVTTGDDITAITDATIPADSFVWLETSVQSGTVTEIHITMKGTID